MKTERERLIFDGYRVFDAWFKLAWKDAAQIALQSRFRGLKCVKIITPEGEHEFPLDEFCSHVIFYLSHNLGLKIEDM